MWYLYALLTVLTWGLWGVFSKLASNYSKPRQALLFQTAGVLMFALLVLTLENFRIEWNAAGFTWAALGGFFAFVGFLTFFAGLEHGKTSTVVTLSALYPLVTILRPHRDCQLRCRRLRVYGYRHQRGLSCRARTLSLSGFLEQRVGRAKIPGIGFRIF